METQWLDQSSYKKDCCLLKVYQTIGLSTEIGRRASRTFELAMAVRCHRS